MTTQGGLSGQTILRFYLPLALSWLFMGLEGPVCIKIISNLRDPAVNTAAFSILMSLAIWIEAPVIDLLSTSTTLSRDKDRYDLISRFVWYLMIWVTIVHALITFTPLYFVVTEGILGVKENVALAARPGMAIMTLWSAFIGWRRYLQGMLIRRGQTRVIGIGTTLRVSMIILGSATLFYTTKWDGVLIASTALLSSVIVESLFIHFVSRRVVAEVVAQRAHEVSLSMRKLAAFHFPLTATTMVKLMVTPIIIAGLARTEQPVLSIAAYQVCSTIMFLHRALGFCLPEVVIALYKDDQSKLALKRFCTIIALGTTGSMLLLSITGATRFIFERVLNSSHEIAELAHWFFLYLALAPALDAVQSYVRGVLTAHHLTVSRLTAVGISVGVLLASVQVTVNLGWSGPAIAGFSLSASLLAELAVLAFSWGHAQAKRDLTVVH